MTAIICPVCGCGDDLDSVFADLYNWDANCCDGCAALGEGEWECEGWPDDPECPEDAHTHCQGCGVTLLESWFDENWDWANRVVPICEGCLANPVPQRKERPDGKHP